jgi:quinohemoprotein ethanol dehydrogenase
MPTKPVVPRELPEQPELHASQETIEKGRQIYAWECAGCHGKDAVARVGGSVPDLRYSDSQAHARWHGIVIGGAMRAGGMPGYEELSVEESEALRAYALSRAAELR